MPLPRSDRALQVLRLPGTHSPLRQQLAHTLRGFERAAPPSGVVYRNSSVGRSGGITTSRSASYTAWGATLCFRQIGSSFMRLATTRGAAGSFTPSSITPG